MNMNTRTRAALAFLVLSAGVAFAGDDGVTDKTITIGQAAALKGAAEALGTGMQTGLNAFFTDINAKGGVNGRTFELKSINDGYEPEKSVQATKMLIEKTKVFAMIGGVGTPTAKAVVPVCTDAKVPFIAPFTGAELLRSPFNGYVVNVRASYNQETEEIAKFLCDTKGFKNIACFYQNDAYGQAGLAGIEAALTRRKLSLTSKGTYERNTTAVQDGLKTIAGATPDAIVMIGAYKPCAEFIKAAKTTDGTKKATFCNISFVGTEALLSELGEASEGVYVSQVMPSPWDESVPLVKEYRAAMKKAGNDSAVGYVSLEGFAAGKFFAEVVSKVEGEPTREKFIATVQKVGTFDLGGFTMTFGSTDNQGSDAVYLTTFTGGKVVQVNTSNIASAGEK